MRDNITRLRQLKNPFENAAKFNCSYLGTMLTHQNINHEDIKKSVI